MAMLEFDYEDIKDEMLRGPRVTSLLPYFENIAKGIAQSPQKTVNASPEFLQKSSDYADYHRVFQRNMGTFYQHLCASVPFFLEEQCRIGVALARLAKQRGNDPTHPCTYYETSAADGTNARTLAEYTRGLFHTLTDSPNVANRETFRQRCQHPWSSIHTGPFVDITPAYLTQQTHCAHCQQGFDVIYENTTFQMYSPNRSGQIAYVKRVLKADGLMIFCEKIMHPDRAEYERREAIKDQGFKATYLTQAAIGEKASQILGEMERCQVTMAGLTAAIKEHFTYAYIIWNSTNFYEIAASNSWETLQVFVDSLGDGYVPEPFLGEDRLIQPLLGL